MFNWHLGDKAATDAAFKAADHVTKIDLINNRVVPAAIEPRAAVGEYDSGTDVIHASHHQPESACRTACTRRVLRYRRGKQAARRCS